ncbi:MAG: hypothetical protein KGD74_06790 [Candidatus Lokiarchaeota archaeon]|nr:hypothetical protein [Candidatus Lokiarchaeota archaeon]
MLDNIDLKLKLKIMYILTIVIAGGFGIMMLIAPSFVIALLSQSAQDLYFYGFAAAVWTTFGLLAILGLRDPIKYMPILLFQFIYKLIWIFAVFLPNVVVDGARFDTIFSLLVFILFIVGDFLTLPFKDFFEKKPD